MAANLELIVTAKDHASGVLGGIDKNASGLSKTLGLGLKAAAVGAGVGIAGLGAFLVSSVKEAMESQEAIAQLESVLKSTGGAAGLTSQQLQDMAGGFQKVTTFSDEAVLGVENLLLTFTNIKSDNFKDTTQAVLDMSIALGQDLKSSSIQVGKALQDPIQGVTALRRVGVQLSDQQEQQIKDFMAVGDVASAQKVILGELAKEFGGSAAAAADTFGGRMQQLKNTFSEVQEKIGVKLLPILQDLAEELSQFLTEHEADIDRIIEQVTEFAELQAWPFLKDTFKQLKDLIQGVKDTGVIQWLAEHKEVALALALALGIVVVAFAPWILAIPTAIALGVLLMANWDEIKAKGDELMFKVKEFPIMGEIVEAVFSHIGAVVKIWMDYIKGVVDVVMGVLTGDWARAWDGLKAIAMLPLNILKADVELVLNLIKGIFGDTWDAIKGSVIIAMNATIGAVESAVNAVIGAIRDMFQHVKDVADAFPGPNPLGNAMQAAIDGMHNVTLGRIPEAGADGSALGAAAVDGVRAGIRDRQMQLFTEVEGMARSVAGRLAHMLEVQSPSRVMFRIGQQVTEGLRLGIAAPPKPSVALASLPMGSRVHTAQQTQQMMGGGATYHFHYHDRSMFGASPAELQKFRKMSIDAVRRELA